MITISKQKEFSQKSTSYQSEYDVIVAGGGPAGIAAAIASARLGASTLLMERYGFLGGMGTAGLVNPFMNYYAGEKQLVKGIFQEVIERLKETGSYGGSGHRFSFEPEELKFVLNEMAVESGVHLLFHSFAADCICQDGVLQGVASESKSGRRIYKAGVYIDCTGDGDLVAKSGAIFEKGRESDGHCQPATLMFMLGGVKVEENSVEFPVAEEYDLPQGRVLFFKMPRQGMVSVNMTRIIQLDATDVDALSKAEVEARRQVKRVVDYLKKHCEGFEDCYLVQTAAQTGIRESRRILGRYQLTAEDVLTCRKFEDAIARCSYVIDIHNPTGKGTVIRKLPVGDWYEIPYGCLMPKDRKNLLVAGRCISSTHEAHSSLRIQPTCYALGQAAGTAAALAVRKGILPGDLNYHELVQSLHDQDAL